MWVHHLRVGTATRAHLALDPAETEVRWVEGRRSRAPRTADTLVLRLRARGRGTVGELDLHVQRVRRLVAPAMNDGAQPSVACERGGRSLVEDLREGRATPRYAAPELVEDSVTFFPNEPGQDPAEIYVPVRPCRDLCFVAEARNHSSEGDGLMLFANVIDGDWAPRVLELAIPPEELSIPIEIGLTSWSERDVWLRFGVEANESAIDDYLYLHGPRFSRCSAPRELVEALVDHDAHVFGGPATPLNGDEILVGPQQTEVAYRFFVQPDLCFSAHARLEDPQAGGSELHVDIKVDGLRHRINTGLLGPVGTLHRVDGYSLHDWTGRWVEVIVGVTPRELGRVFWVDPRVHVCETES